LPDTLAFDHTGSTDDVDGDELTLALRLPKYRSHADSGEGTQPPTPVNPADVSVCTTTAPNKADEDGDGDEDEDSETSTDSGCAGDTLAFHTLCAIVSVVKPADHQDEDEPTCSAPKYTDESPAHTRR
jgi:hypothetical protein